MTDNHETSAFARRRAPLAGLLIIVLLLLPALLLIRPLARGEIPYFMDTLMYFFPQRVHAAHLLARGEWPLWNRCIMAGTPLFENPQAALGFPLNWPSLAWPGGFWFTFPMLFELGLYGALTAWALRRLGVGGAAALWAGALALAGNYGWSRLQFGNYLGVLPWWPLWLGAAQAFARSSHPRRAWWLLVGAVAVALMLLAGAHQLAAYGLTGLGLYGLVQALSDRGARARWWTFLLLTFGLGVALGAPGWLPQLSFIAQTSRAQGLGAAQVLTGAIGSWRELIQSLIWSWQIPSGPVLWFDAESSAWVGLGALLLALLPPARGPRRRTWIACWLVILITILFSLKIVVEPLLAALPLSALFHDPRRWLGVTQWFLILAAALSVGDWLRRGRLGARLEVRGDRAIGRTALIGGLLFILGWILTSLALCWPLLGLPAELAPAFLYALGLNALGWLPVALFLLANRLGPGRLRGSIQAVALLVVALTLAALTWRTTDLKTIVVDRFLNPQTPPLLQGAKLQPGERFFSLDYERAASYDYTRPDLLDWALPDLAMLWDVEDLGGYEPAQSARYRAFMQRIHAAEPWRQPYAEHFGLVQNPLARAELDQANVRAALMPRWGLPLFIRPAGRGDRFQAEYPLLFTRNFPVRALFAGGDSSTVLTLAVREGENLWHYALDRSHPVGFGDDLAAPAVALSGPRATPPGGGRVFAARGDLPPQFGVEPRPILLQATPPLRLFDLYVWSEALADLWKPLRVGPIAALMRYQGAPAWTQWTAGTGAITGQIIKANEIDLAFEGSGPAAGRLVIHDAGWPGWHAWLDGRSVPIEAEGLWRAVAAPLGPHRLIMRYQPPEIERSLWIAAGALVLLVLLCAGLYLKRNSEVSSQKSEPLAKVQKNITAGGGCATIIGVFCGTGTLAGDKNRLLQEARQNEFVLVLVIVLVILILISPLPHEAKTDDDDDDEHEHESNSAIRNANANAPDFVCNIEPIP